MLTGPELAKILCWDVADAAWGDVEEVVEHGATTGGGDSKGREAGGEGQVKAVVWKETERIL